MSVKLRKKSLKNGRAALFLDISWDGQRWKEYLGLWLEKPVNSVVLQENNLKIQTAQNLCLQREHQLLQAVPCLRTPQENLLDTDFLEVFAHFISSYRRKDIKTVKAAYLHLRSFVNKPSLPFSFISKPFCEDFLSYLYDTLKGNTPVGYFKKFKMCLEQCVENGMLVKNPAHGIRLVSSEAITKDILDTDEIQALADTPLQNTELKRAFLFACHTGLRWCDVCSLQYKSIDFQRNMLTVRQRKVANRSSKAVLHLNMNSTAVHLLQLQTGLSDDYVFKLPSYSYSRRILMDWAHRAGLKKHITFHCARHSFITNIMLRGANIKTASLLAGHSTIRHTEKYVHIVDELKQHAVDSLPVLRLDL